MEANKSPILGKSLPVPCVQDLAKENLTSVPARYVRPDLDPPTMPDTTSFPQVPVIDLQKLFVGAGGEGDESELKKFDLACANWGFFQVINHGVSRELVEEVKKEVEEFYRLPMEEKKKWFQKPGDVEGFGQMLVVSEEQKLDWCDMFYFISHPPHLIRDSPSDTLEEYSTELRLLALKLLDTISKALKMDGKDMTQLFEEGWQGMRMNYLPPCPEPELVLGLNSHSDPVGITILLQLNEVEGLQIKKDGKWLPVKPLPDAFIVNIGDILEVVTNGRYKSYEHRAVTNSKKERLSLATFYNPNMNGDLGPAPSLVTPSTPALFRRIGVQDYFKGFFARDVDGKSYINVMRI